MKRISFIAIVLFSVGFVAFQGSGVTADPAPKAEAPKAEKHECKCTEKSDKEKCECKHCQGGDKKAECTCKVKKDEPKK